MKNEVKVRKENIKLKNDVLEYIGLDLEKIPEKKLKETTIHFSAYSNEKTYKVYDYISVKDLEVLITPLERTADLKERYKTAKPLLEYLKSEDSKMKKTFLEVLDLASVNEIKEIEELQKKLKKEQPYFIRYEKNYLWQIYYSEEDKKYFMLFPANEGETSVLFYIIKKKLERRDTKIFVPISKKDYSGEILSVAEINDIENYMWLFTNEWPNIYEISQKELYIIGRTKINGIFDSYYKNVYYSKEQANDFYLLLKAMFILTTETNYKYSFKPYVNENGELELKYKDKIINTKDLSNFIDDQTDYQKKRKIELEREIKQSENEIELLKEYVKKQNEIYVIQEKQIVMFLKCKKSFFRRLSYFFKSKKFTTPKIEIESHKEEEKFNTEIELGSSHTIKELISIVAEVNNIENISRDLKSDIKALKIKKENLERKIKNAANYIAEIEEHKKSIFEFWKFTNKDAIPTLEVGKEENNKKVQGAFDLEQDIEGLGIKADKMQRQKLSINECNAVYIANKLLEAVNYIEDDTKLENILKELKEKIKSEENSLGNLFEDYAKRKTLSNKEHRENARNELRILRIEKHTKLEEFKNELEINKKLLKEAYSKIKSENDITIYIKEFDKKAEYVIGYINPKNILRKLEKNIKVYKIKVEQGAHLLYFSNIIFFNNTNGTLPLGMDIETNVLIKTPQIDEKHTNKEEIYLLLKEDDFNCNIKKIEIIEGNI